MTAFVGALLAVAVLATSAAAAGNKTGQTCNKGQFANYVDPATGQPWATESACTSSFATTHVVYPLSAAACFDSSWFVIKDQNNGADGSATSGRACGDFVLGGGSLAGLRLTTSGTPISRGYTLDAFAVSFLDLTTLSGSCSPFDGRIRCTQATGVSSRSIASPYTYAESNTLDCSLSGSLVSRDRYISRRFTTLGGYGLGAETSCSSR